MKNIVPEKSDNGTFRTDNNNKINDSFQTKQMEERLKNIKKRKRKMKNNFKNIEEFDTLKNSDSDSDEEGTDKERGSPKKHYSKDNPDEIEKEDESPVTITTLLNKIFEILQTPFKDKMKEGVRFNRDDYEGYDNVKEGQRSQYDVRAILIASIEKTYNRINKINTIIAKFVLNLLTNGRYTENDLIVTRENIVWIMSILVASFAVVNWYFILIYTKDQKIPLFKFSRNKLLQMTVHDGDENSSDSGPAFAKFAFWVFEFAVAFFEYFNDIFLLIIPSIMRFFFSGRTNYVILFLVLIYCFKNFANAFKNFLIGLIGNTTDNKIINMMYGLLMVLYVISLGTINFTGTFSVDMQTITDYIGAFASPITTFIKMIIRFMVVMIVSVPAGGLVIGGIFLYYSFFGIVHYQGVSEFMNTLKDIIRHCNEDVDTYSKTTYCKSSFFHRMMLMLVNIIKMVFNLVWNFITPLVLSIFLLVSASKNFDLLSSVKTVVDERPLNMLVSVLHIVFGILVIAYIVITQLIYSPGFQTLVGWKDVEIPHLFKDTIDETDIDASRIKQVEKAEGMANHSKNKLDADTLFDSFKQMMKETLVKDDTPDQN